MQLETWSARVSFNFNRGIRNVGSNLPAIDHYASIEGPCAAGVPLGHLISSFIDHLTIVCPTGPASFVPGATPRRLNRYGAVGGNSYLGCRRWLDENCRLGRNADRFNR